MRFFLIILFSLIIVVANSEELVLGEIKIVVKGTSGFIDEIYVDLNDDKKFDANELLMGSEPTDVDFRFIIFDLSLAKDKDQNLIVLKSHTKVTKISKEEKKILLHGNISYEGSTIKGSYVVEFHLKELDSFKWKDARRKKEKISGKVKTILTSYEIKWENLPKGALLVRAGLALNLKTNIEKQLVITGTKAGATNFAGAGYPVGPVMGGTWVGGPTGGSLARYSLWFQKSKLEASSLVYCFGSGKSSSIARNFKEQKWVDLCDSDKGLAVIVQGMADVAPKAFGTMPVYTNEAERAFNTLKHRKNYFSKRVSFGKRDRVLYMWFWPEFHRGFPLKNATKYYLKNIALVPHKGRSIKWEHTPSSKKRLHIWMINRKIKNPYDLGFMFDNLVLPKATGNLKAATTQKPLKLQKVDLSWVDAKLPVKIISSRPQGKKIPIEITDYYQRKTPKGLNLPYRVGSSFPKGLIKSVKQLNVVSNKEQAIPFQIKVTAYWPDHSIKWILIDFILTPQEVKQSPAAWLLYSSAEINQQSTFSNIISKQLDGRVEVDTGKIKAVMTNQSGIFETVHIDLNNDKQYAASEEIISPKSSGERRAFLDYIHADNLADWLSGSFLTKGKLGKSHLKINRVTIDTNGPVRCTVKVSGVYMTPGFKKIEIPYDYTSPSPRSVAGKPWMPTAAKEGSGFTIYLTFYKDLSYVKVWHHFIFEGISGYQHVKKLGIGSKINIDEKSKTLSFEISEGVKTLKKSGPLILTQENDQMAKVSIFNEKTLEQSVIAQGQKNSDWLDVSDDKWGVAVGLKDMYEKNPQGIKQSGKMLTVNFWDPVNGPWDSRGTTYGLAKPFTGISRSHETVWVFHAKEETFEKTKAMIEHVTKPEFAIVSPEWICATKAFGLVSAFDRNIPVEKIMLERVLKFFNSGDGPCQSAKSFLPGISRYGTFSSVEGYTNYGLALLALRSGSHRLIRGALAKSRSDAEISYRKGKTREASNSSRVNANHPKDITISYYRTASSFGARGINLMYYMTGDEGLRDFSAYMAANVDWKVAGGISKHRTINGIFLWAWEQRYGQADYELKLEKSLPKLIEYSKNNQFGFGSFEMYGAANSVIEIYLHSDKHKKTIESVLNNRALSLSEGVVLCQKNGAELIAELASMKKVLELKQAEYVKSKTAESKLQLQKTKKDYQAVERKKRKALRYASQSARHMATTSFMYWKEGTFKSKAMENKFKEYLKNPPTGGAFGHHLFSECHNIPVALKAIKVHSKKKKK